MKIFSVVLISIIIYFNVKIYFGPDLKSQKDVLTSSMFQLNYLENGLKNENFGSKSQEIFPEGFVFINALYGLSWCELAKKNRSNPKIFKKGLEEAKYAYYQLKSHQAQSTFSENLLLIFGAFYNSWTNYLLAKIVSLENKKNTLEYSDFEKKCDEINSAIMSNSYSNLESYPNQIWPADNLGMIASLKIHDNFFEKKYNKTIEKFIEKINDQNKTGFISHSEKIGKEYPRGSSSSLMLIFLSENDPQMALGIFNNYKNTFLTYKLGQGGIREYPKNIKGESDIDSGPVFLDIGFSGTIVSIGTFLKFNEIKIANKISNEVETLGLPITFNNEKKYLFGTLPIADAFIVWSRLQSPTYYLENDIIPESNVPLHALSIIFLSILIFLIIKRKQKI